MSALHAQVQRHEQLLNEQGSALHILKGRVDHHDSVLAALAELANRARIQQDYIEKHHQE